MNITVEQIDELLKEYNWLLASVSPLEIHSLDGEHAALNVGAEIVIEYIAMLHMSENTEEKESFRERFKPKT